VASKLSHFLAELKRRKVTRVLVVYAAVAWAAVEVADTTFPNLQLPPWTVTLVVVLALLGFPVTAFLAWVFDVTPQGIRRTGEAGAEEAAAVRWPVSWPRRIAAALAVPLAVALAVVVTLRLSRPPVRTLDPRQVVVYPLEISDGGGSSLGEDASTWIGYVLEASGRVRWLDGWYALSRMQRAGIGPSGPAAFRSDAEAQGAAYFVRGRISVSAESARVLLELHDVQGDSVAARGNASGPTEQGWTQRLSEEAARQILGALPGAQDPERLVMPSDTPVAIRRFLEGERRYRRSRFKEALGYYRQAVEADSAFALAGLKGTLAALWQHDNAEAGSLLRVVRARSPLLSPRHAYLAEGLDHYIGGRADAAVESLEQALAAAPEWWEARARLGEVYTHLLPRKGPPDSLAEAAFLEVHRQDPGFTPVLFHLMEMALRKGEVGQAEEYFVQFRSAEPDSALLAQAELKLRCVRDTPDLVDWRGAFEEDPDAVYAVAEALAIGARQADCARAAWTAVLQHDTASGDAGIGRRFSSTMGLHSLLLAEGRTADAFALWESDEEFSYMAGDFYLLADAAGAEVGAAADSAIVAFSEMVGTGEAPPSSLWILGAALAARGEAAAARALADTLSAWVEEGGGRPEALMARSLQARSTLARGDTVRALALLRLLVPDKPLADPWYPWESLGGEQLLLAEILHARQEYGEVLRLTAGFDAPARPETDLIYLPRALSLRQEAAAALGDETLARQCRERLRRLGWGE
jgi:tetratricopeptide (TPR) repeat protein